MNDIKYETTIPKYECWNEIDRAKIHFLINKNIKEFKYKMLVDHLAPFKKNPKRNKLQWYNTVYKIKRDKLRQVKNFNMNSSIPWKIIEQQIKELWNQDIKLYINTTYKKYNYRILFIVNDNNTISLKLDRVHVTK